MITAVDSSVLLDIFTDSAQHRDSSLRHLQRALEVGAVVVCPVVWAEIWGAFADAATLRKSLSAAGLTFDGFDRACAELAGEAFRAYRRAGGSRQRMIADFMVGAHAQVRGGRLLSRDRGFFRSYFAGLEVIG